MTEPWCQIVSRANKQTKLASPGESTAAAAASAVAASEIFSVEGSLRENYTSYSDHFISDINFLKPG